MDESQGIDILSWVRALGRRVWLVLIVFIVGSVLATAVAYVLPPVYESSAQIMVESQQIPERLAQSTVGQSPAERLRFIEQRLMTRQNLLDIIDRTGLFADRPDLSATARVEQVRAATSFDTLAFNRGRGPALVTAFTISYRANEPGTAARMANEFVTMALEQNVTTRTTRARETYAFFNDTVKRLSDKLLDLETQIAQYKEKNKGALPQSLDFRMSELSAIERRQAERQRRRIHLAERQRILEQSLEAGTGAPGTPQSPAERRLAELRRELVQKRSVFSESHPKVVALKASISALEASLAGDSAAAGPGTGEGGGENADAPTSLAARQAKLQLEMIEQELAHLATRDKADATRAKELHASIARTPQVEMALNAYKRRYATLQTRYDSTVQKLADAAAGQRLEVNRKAGHFEVIEQARVPRAPVAPPRLMIAAGGAAASLGLAIGLALLLELAKPALRTSADLQRRLQLRPVVSVPHIHTRGERRRLALKWVIRIALVVGALALLLWAVDQYVTPLRVLWAHVLDRVGFESLIRAIRARLT